MSASAPDMSSGPSPAAGVVPTLAGALAAAVLCGVLELLVFAFMALDPAPDNLGVTTLWDARPTRWWQTPIMAGLIAIWLPRLVLTPRGLIDAARGRDGAAGATLGLVAWCVVASLGIVWLVFGTDWRLGAILVSTLAIWLGGFALFGALKHAGLSGRVSAVVAAALFCVALDAYAQTSPRAFDCKDGLGLKLRSGEEVACRSVDWFRNRESVVARRADGSSWLVAKSAIDPASLIATLGPGAVALYPLKPVD